ncbi:MAG: homocysteine S-methyltransferase [Actinomycetia bacterium]|nr:homocysteine S-methyltransferase [Actinomycetes bacterium]
MPSHHEARSLSEQLAERPVLLDGGLATTLELLGHDISGDLWSARLLLDQPNAIIEAHTAFFAAGAEVATTASYQATFDGFAANGIDRAQTATLMKKSVLLAREAANQVTGRPTWVAASIGPYGAMLADGSEYRGGYGLTVGELREFHRPRIEVLAAAGADVLAFETLPCATEVEAVLLEVDEVGLECWVSVSIDGARTRAGEPLDDVFAMAAGVPSVIAVGVNCSTPSDATAAVSVAARTGKPVVIYPNSGEGWDAMNRTWVAAESDPHFPVERWVAEGARLVGGCCRVTPADISAMAVQLGH